MVLPSGQITNYAEALQQHYNDMEKIGKNAGSPMRCCNYKFGVHILGCRSSSRLVNFIVWPLVVACIIAAIRLLYVIAITDNPFRIGLVGILGWCVSIFLFIKIESFLFARAWEVENRDREERNEAWANRLHAQLTAEAPREDAAPKPAWDTDLPF